jgi:diguanylate cyclase (GGDEF)-like protein
VYYSTIGLLAALIMLIENADLLFGTSDTFDRPSWQMYRKFLFAVLMYYTTDILWGILESQRMATALFVDTSVFFAAMAAGVHLWTRYAVAYIEERSAFARFLLHAGRVFAAAVAVLVVANVFVPVLFTVDASCVYHALPARYVILAVQILLLLLVSVHTARVENMDDAGDKIARYRAVAFFGLIMAVFLTAQLPFPYLPLYTIAYLLATCLLRAFVVAEEKEQYRAQLEETEKILELRQSYKEALSTSAVFESIVEALSADYFDLFYVDIETGSYVEYGMRSERGQKIEERRGEDFFGECMSKGTSLLLEEDLERVTEALSREHILAEVGEHGSYIYYYRVLIDGDITYVSLKATRLPGDDQHIVIGVSNVDDQMRDHMAAERAAEERKSYQRLSALADNMVALYLVDCDTSAYTEFRSSEGYESMGIAKQGDDFFRISRENGARFVHPEDREMFNGQFTKENIVAAIARAGVFELDYRLVGGGLPTYVKLKVAQVEEDGKAVLVVGLLDEDVYVQREREHERDLSAAKTMAVIDPLTGVKNKHAYAEWEARINAAIEAGAQEPFAVAVCDVNGLKLVNDLLGHREGDICIKNACRRICKAFSHSPVFRVGGDEFAVILTGGDFERRSQLAESVIALPEDAAQLRMGEGVAVGVADYDPDRHHNLLGVFEDADKAMYKCKQRMKGAHPIEAAAPEEDVEPRGIPAINVRRTILVADDIEMNREIMGELLVDDYDIIYASDGVETLEQLREHKDVVDLVLLDLYMPRMTGREVIAEMQLDEELTSIPVIFLTVDQDAELDCLRIGAMDFIPKPFPDIEIVKARISKCIELSEDRDLIRHTERDRLTGLLNKEYFFRYVVRLDQLHKDEGMDAVACYINNLHVIGERYGRQFVDILMHNMGAGLRRLAREVGGLGCMDESDMFLLYCPHRDDHERLLKEFMDDVLANDKTEERVDLRFGVFVDAQQESDVEERFARAEAAAQSANKGLSFTS